MKTLGGKQLESPGEPRMGRRGACACSDKEQKPVCPLPVFTEEALADAEVSNAENEPRTPSGL